MKTSNKLLLILLAVLFLGMLGSSMALKSEYDKIDKDDPFHGYVTESVERFRVVKLQNRYPDLVQIQPGEKFEIKMRDHREDIQQIVRNDTLLLIFPDNDLPPYYSFSNVANRQRPWIYITAPQLSSVYTQGSICRISGWQQPDLDLVLEGPTAGLLLSGNTVESLAARVAQGSTLEVKTDNQLRQAQVQVQDSSTFLIENQVLDSLELQVDNSAQVKLPGNLLRQISF